MSLVRKIALGAALLLAGYVTFCAVYIGTHSRQWDAEADRNAITEREQIRTGRLSSIKAALVSLTTSGDANKVARLCAEAAKLDPSSLAADQRERCVRAGLSSARDALRSGDVMQARAGFDDARVWGASPQSIAEVESALKAAELRAAREREREQKIAAKQQARVASAQAKLARVAYGESLRERFLDKNLDIKVRVSGADGDRMTLEFALFNDVWAHRIQKDGLLDEIRDNGFKRLDMVAYDYHVSWDLSK